MNVLGEGCTRPNSFYRYRVHEYSDIQGSEQEEKMMSEIYQRGPIACGIEVTDELYKNYTGGVFYDRTNATNINHDISVVGYGVDSSTGLKYWLIRNSWGTYWVSFIFSILKAWLYKTILFITIGIELSLLSHFFCREKMDFFDWSEA